ncbi:MAG: hypothetical protein ABI588_04975 [Arenimonas sp.]
MSTKTSKTDAKKEVKSTEKQPAHGKAVNMGPQRGNNSFPASNKAIRATSRLSSPA